MNRQERSAEMGPAQQKLNIEWDHIMALTDNRYYEEKREFRLAEAAKAAEATNRAIHRAFRLIGPPPNFL